MAALSAAGGVEGVSAVSVRAVWQKHLTLDPAAPALFSSFTLPALYY